MTEHKHAAVLRAIANGRAGQYKAHHHSDSHDVWITGDAYTNPITRPDFEWRIKPEPRTPRRIWVNEYGDNCTQYAYKSKAIADINASTQRIACIEFVEVIPDE